MKIAYVLPGPATKPGGGARVVYRLAANLVSRGHRVTILHPVAWLGSQHDRQSTVHRLASYAKHRLVADFTPRAWLPSLGDVDPRLVPRINSFWIGQNDVVIATAWRTFAPVFRLPARCGVKVAHIQHLEEWDGGKEAVLSAWKLPIAKIVIARWLGRLLEQLGQEGELVGNGVDHDLFYVETTPEYRSQASIAMMASDLAFKGTECGLKALVLLKRRIPGLQAKLFCTTPVHLDLPEWIRVYVNPSPAELRRIYNFAQVFLAPSFTEGWDLPACEAMACGAALVASDIPVREEYVVNGESGLLVEPGMANAMSAAAQRLLEDGDLRIRLANAGLSRARALTWDRAGEQLEAALERIRSTRLPPLPQ
jgi:glycosyltransferase involved in cell wall biosynthesis